MDWYYAEKGQTIGPLSDVEFERLAATGTITANTPVWNSGMSDWQPYGTMQTGSQVTPLADTPMAADGNAAVAMASERQRECPACAEAIPADSISCPYCSESLRGHMDSATLNELLAARTAEVEQHVADKQKLEEEERAKGGRLTKRTITMIVLTALSLVGTLAAFLVPDEDLQVMVAVFGIIGLFIFGLCTLVSACNDKSTRQIHAAADPVKAFKRYWLAIRTRRLDNAFLALAPTARTIGMVNPYQFSVIPSTSNPLEITDPKSFGNYWKDITKGPSTHHRGCTVTKVKKIGDISEGLALVDVKFRFTSYPAWMMLVFGGLILALAQKTEKLQVQKLLIRRGDRWYVAEGELQGLLDSVTL